MKVFPKNWSFPGLSEANLCVLEPRVFPPKVEKCAQGFPNLVTGKDCQAISVLDLYIGSSFNIYR
jgi:hypothetical protein